MPGHRAGGDLLGGAEAAAGRGALESGRVTARYRGLGRRRLGLQRRKLENSLFCSPEPPKFQHVQRRSPRSGVHLAQVRLSPTGPFLRRRPAALRDPGGDGRLHGCVDRAAVAPGGRVPCRLGTLPSTFGPKASTGNPNNVRRHHGSSGVRGGTGSTGVPPNSSHSQTLECDLL